MSFESVNATAAAATTAPSSASAYLTLGLEAAGALVNTYASTQSSAANKRALDYQAQVAENNATLARWKAKDAIERGQTEAARVQLKARQLKGAQRAAFASNGLDLGEGSALRILSDTDFLGAIDSNTAIDNAAKESWAYQNEANDYLASAELYRSRAAAENPFLTGASTLLTGATSVAKSWYTFRSAGVI